VKFAATRSLSIERIVMVGDWKWEAWMAKPFTMAKVKYFEASQIDDAWAWINEA
jgi:hypothetical protein